MVPSWLDDFRSAVVCALTDWNRDVVSPPNELVLSPGFLDGVQTFECLKVMHEAHVPRDELHLRRRVPDGGPKSETGWLYTRAYHYDGGKAAEVITDYGELPPSAKT
jgi:hypothetical protein